MNNEQPEELTVDFSVPMDYPQIMGVVTHLLSEEGWSITPLVSRSGFSKVMLPAMRLGARPDIMSKYFVVTDTVGNELNITITTNLWFNTKVSKVSIKGKAPDLNANSTTELIRRMDRLKNRIEHEDLGTAQFQVKDPTQNREEQHAISTTSEGETRKDPTQRESSGFTPSPMDWLIGRSSDYLGSIFISYRRADTEYESGYIGEELVTHFGKRARVFIDVTSIPLGRDYRKHLSECLAQCSVLLAVIGRQWLTIESAPGQRRLDDPHDLVRIEIEAALTRNIAVIPILVQGASVPSANQLPPSLRELAYRNATRVRPAPDFRHDMERLIRELETLLKQRPS